MEEQSRRHSKVEQELYRLDNWDDKDLEELRVRLFDVAYDENERAKEEATTVPLTLDDIAQVKEDAKNFGLPTGLGTHLWQVDNMTAGFAPGELTVVIGATSQGKSLFCANLFAQQAMSGHKCVFVTLETEARKFWERIYHIMGEEQMNWCALNKTMYVQAKPRIPWQSIKYLVKHAKEELGAEIVYIDHLHYFARDMQDQANGLGIITKEFKVVALENQIPIVLVSHIKKTEDREARPRIDDARGSSLIGQDADIVLSVWQTRSKVQEPHIWVGLEKNRNRTIWQDGVAQTLFYRDGLKILPRPYSMEEDHEFNVTKRFQRKWDEAHAQQGSFGGLNPRPD